eukprot:2233837-Prymnesium_polylepis.1
MEKCAARMYQSAWHVSKSTIRWLEGGERHSTHRSSTVRCSMWACRRLWRFLSSVPLVCCHHVDLCGVEGCVSRLDGHTAVSRTRCSSLHAFSLAPTPVTRVSGTRAPRGGALGFLA